MDVSAHRTLAGLLSPEPPVDRRRSPPTPPQPPPAHVPVATRLDPECGTDLAPAQGKDLLELAWRVVHAAEQRKAAMMERSRPMALRGRRSMGHESSPQNWRERPTAAPGSRAEGPQPPQRPAPHGLLGRVGSPAGTLQSVGQSVAEATSAKRDAAEAEHLVRQNSVASCASSGGGAARRRTPTLGMESSLAAASARAEACFSVSGVRLDDPLRRASSRPPTGPPWLADNALELTSQPWYQLSSGAELQGSPLHLTGAPPPRTAGPPELARPCPSPEQAPTAPTPEPGARADSRRSGRGCRCPAAVEEAEQTAAGSADPCEPAVASGYPGAGPNAEVPTNSVESAAPAVRRASTGVGQATRRSRCTSIIAARPEAGDGGGREDAAPGAAPAAAAGAGPGVPSASSSGRESSAAMRRSKSMPASEKRGEEPTKSHAATPTLRKMRAANSNGSSALPKSTSSAAAAAGSLAWRNRKKACPTSKKLVLPFAYTIDDPRHFHVESTEGRICPEFLP
mmetsp:Transcript_67683/g.218636  ORF Transcript_67683/g.218636 Transcript_67683/m.218636 type:complete len:512 (+) Transcript_67683:226-1761(+)